MKVWLYEETHTSNRHIFATHAAAKEYIRDLTEWQNSEGISGELKEGLDYFLDEREVGGLNMWIQVEDIHERKSCINLDYISCINPQENCVDIVFSDGAVAQIKPTFISASGRKVSTYTHLCNLLTEPGSNFC